MSIPFPKMHIATSVLNRIMNTLEEKGPFSVSNKQSAAPEMQESPLAPNPTVLGMEINNELKNEPAPVAVAPEEETDANNGMLDASVMGGSPFDGALIGKAGS